MSAPALAHELRVLVLADPGLPFDRAQSVQDRFEDALSTAFGVPASVRTRAYMLPITLERAVDLEDIRRIREEESRELPVDAILVLTEMPRHDSRPIVAETDEAEGVAILSLPTMGVTSRRRRMIRMFTACTARLTGLRPVRDLPGAFDAPWTTSEGRAGVALLRAPRVLGSARTVVGMIATNQPWRTAPRLSRAFAAALAAGAFGIFYTSIWEMSAALSPERLGLITVLAIVSMTLWLMVSNGLWDRAVQESHTRVIFLYNMSTLATLLLSVIAVYALLMVLILVSGLIVIDPQFLEDTIGRRPTLSRYVDIAWLSASLGVFAGALGASFDSSTDLRGLTHGRREAQRVPTD